MAAYSAVGRLGRRILAVGSTVGAVVSDAAASSNLATFDGDGFLMVFPTWTFRRIPLIGGKGAC